MARLLDTNRKTDYLLPPFMDDWLPEGHLARFIVEVIDQLDLSLLVQQYAGRGHKAYHPATLLAILVYGYANGVFSSRKLEQATYDSVAFRYLAAGSHPDHDTLATFRRRFLGELQGLFVQVLELAQEMKLLKIGRVCLDGTKIHANASKHQALSHGHIEQMERHLQAEVQELFALAEQADQSGIPEGVNLPEEIQRRTDQLAVMAAAKAKIAERAQACYAKEKAQYDTQMARRAEREVLGQKPRGKATQAPDPTPKAQDQINLTDEESRIMPVSGGGFEQTYNAQAAVDDQTMLVVATGVSQAPNDKEQVIPMLETLQAQTAQLGPIEALVADMGYCSEKNVEACEALGITPFIAVAREEHHPDWRQRHTEPEDLPENATRMQAMIHRLKTQAGRSVYRLRKQTVEPVFGIIKSVMGFRQFSLRGLRQVQGEWSLVCLAWNIKRMAVLRL
ncbi:IS1182 family transposase [Acidithiobacillus sulfurivorans]|uniref:IS1182 family transposase n=1 Tax=Acidithiobacillus sulfurivorans TaxID=1958756 RepID=A0ABS5ZVY4_9PROT|nr:IS1182 family transposase [Acidithiobacillus sulfurivorans]MBU2759383.1 IS1182 family transposase [Acidithiobacillus sulfurivorans]